MPTAAPRTWVADESPSYRNRRGGGQPAGATLDNDPAGGMLGQPQPPGRRRDRPGRAPHTLANPPGMMVPEGPRIEPTQEQRREGRDAGGGPVRLTDPETKAEYVVLKAELYERMRRVFEEVDPSLYEFEETDPR